jgi:hypothetical protein
MKQKYFFHVIFSLTTLLIGIKFLSPQQNERDTAHFSHITVNSKNFIDVSKLVISDYEHISRKVGGEVYITKDNSFKQVFFNNKQLRSLKSSPSLNQAAFSYYPDEPSDQELSLAVLDFESGVVKEIFHTNFPSWDITSDVHWLGNKYLFFSRHCGTGCQGITLLNIETSEIRNAVLSYPSFPNQPETTHFTDWLGNEYLINGLVSEVTSQTVGSNNYLVFNLGNSVGEHLGTKSIPFLDPQDDLLLSLTEDPI